ncbi:zinc finger protein 37 homolog isoform X2 [Dendroctonus ponderosae]|uniref:C2H2-type domain-containing protein n=1 Tax=Dendroctonus ponderosae TaxID=77166 RepID=A0AAR5PGC5_DENPD|nr:zinc finger protein 37 homolog isoform X2 [Dendroctonus ponderosae]
MNQPDENEPETGKNQNDRSELTADNIIIEIIQENDKPDEEPLDIPELVTINIKRECSSNSDVGFNSSELLCETDEIKVYEIPGTDEGEYLNLIDQDPIDTDPSQDLPNDVLVYSCQSESNDALHCYPCKSCSMVSGCIFCLKSHYESVHLNLGLIQYKCDNTTYLKEYTEICHKCNLVCESKQEMIDHRKIHFVSCDVCDMSFDSALFLSNHCRATHEKLEDVADHHSAFDFISSGTKQVIISCDLCEQWFKHLQDLSDHYEDYHGMILCIVCFKRFSNRDELLAHHGTHKIVLTDVIRSVLPYACSKCNQAFAEISELSAHLVKCHPCHKTTYADLTKKKREGTKGKHQKNNLQFDDCGGLSQDQQVEFHQNDSKRLKKS